MKRTLYILLSATICLFLFAKCELNSSDDENTEENIDVTEYEQKIVGFWVAIQDMDEQGKIVHKYDTTDLAYPTYYYYSSGKKSYSHNRYGARPVYDHGAYMIYSIGNEVRIRYGDNEAKYEIINPITDYLCIRNVWTTQYKRTNEKFTVPE
jgi:hypothetical protein